MNTPHTPGPWTAEDQSGTDVHFFTIRSPQNCYIAGLHEYDGATIPAMEANARLIATAPELLSALQFLLNDYLAISGPALTRSSVPARKAMSAILKATTTPQ